MIEGNGHAAVRTQYISMSGDSSDPKKLLSQKKTIFNIFVFKKNHKKLFSQKPFSQKKNFTKKNFFHQ